RQTLAHVADGIANFYEIADIGLGDFDNDGTLDILQVWRPKYDNEETMLSVQKINGEQFSPIFTLDSWSDAAVVGDFNRDGYADVALPDANGTQILLGDGT